MAMLFRRGDTVVCVHAHDPAAVEPKIQTPAERWILATGQPDACTKVEVRPLTDSEMDRVRDSGDDGNKLACELGIVAVDGSPFVAGDYLDAALVEFAQLVGFAGAFPFLGRKLLADETTDD